MDLISSWSREFTKCPARIIFIITGVKKQRPETNRRTPWKINMEPENDGLVQMIFLFKMGDVLGSSIFRGFQSLQKNVQIQTNLVSQTRLEHPCHHRRSFGLDLAIHWVHGWGEWWLMVVSKTT